VVPLAIGHEPQSDLPVEPLREKFRLPRPYILFVGTLEPRKNIVSLLEAYRRISESRDELLVIVGKKGWFYESIFTKVKELELNERVRFTGFVSEEEKFALIRHCRIFIYPSLYEGFGLPVLEALSMGIPTITSNISSMPEVAGDAALLTDPGNIAAIAGAMLRLLNDPEKRLELSVKAVRQASRFSWENTAQQTLALYKNLSASSFIPRKI
jgi:glycosyltransferase involved in cell wall biosynthesis